MNAPVPKSPPFVVAFTGAQGVGKSTLVSALEMELARLGISPCTAHENLGQTAAAKGVPLGQHANALTLMEFAKLHVRRERHLGEGIHLLDRCFVDLLAYAFTVCGDQSILIELIEELTRTSLPGIDVVVRVPMIPALTESRSPKESTQFRIQIDQAIARILPDLGVKFLEVSQTRIEERVQNIIAFLREESFLLGACQGGSAPQPPIRLI